MASVRRLRLIFRSLKERLSRVPQFSFSKRGWWTSKDKPQESVPPCDVIGSSSVASSPEASPATPSCSVQPETSESEKSPWRDTAILRDDLLPFLRFVVRFATDWRKAEEEMRTKMSGSSSTSKRLRGDTSDPFDWERALLVYLGGEEEEEAQDQSKAIALPPPAAAATVASPSPPPSPLPVLHAVPDASVSPTSGPSVIVSPLDCFMRGSDPVPLRERLASALRDLDGLSLLRLKEDKTPSITIESWRIRREQQEQQEQHGEEKVEVGELEKKKWELVGSSEYSFESFQDIVCRVIRNDPFYGPSGTQVFCEMCVSKEKESGRTSSSFMVGRLDVVVVMRGVVKILELKYVNLASFWNEEKKTKYFDYEKGQFSGSGVPKPYFTKTTKSKFRSLQHLSDEFVSDARRRIDLDLDLDLDNDVGICIRAWGGKVVGTFANLRAFIDGFTRRHFGEMMTASKQLQEYARLFRTQNSMRPRSLSGEGGGKGVYGGPMRRCPFVEGTVETFLCVGYFDRVMIERLLVG